MTSSDGGTVTIIGVRHHSPACARLVAETIAAVRPAYVLVEGPADMNDRLDELRLPHTLPIAVFTSYRARAEPDPDAETAGDSGSAAGRHRVGASWSPFCGYSPEWVALTAAAEVGAEFRFIDLPAWHPAFGERDNRYADADRRYHDVTERLCHEFGVDNVDTLWDHLVEAEPGDGLAVRLETYFDVARGDADASGSDLTREAYMASWIRAARTAAGCRPVVVVCGGFHRPALVRLTAADGLASGGLASGGLASGGLASGGTAGSVGWPVLPVAEGCRSFLVPFSFRRLDSFDGYQSGMPSPEYYQQLWERGAAGAAGHLLEAIATRLRAARYPVSTADLIAARTMAEGLTRLRGHPHPMRTDLLDGLVGALVGEALDSAPPWTGRGRLPVGTHPVVVEMIAALSGDRTGRLAPDTPLPPLVADVTAELDRVGLGRLGSGLNSVPASGPAYDGRVDGPLRLDLTDDGQRERSRILHRLQILDIPGFRRLTGPSVGGSAGSGSSAGLLAETWHLEVAEHRLVALIEAGGYGATLADAAAARLAARLGESGADIDALADVLFGAALAGFVDLSDRMLEQIRPAVGTVTDLAALGRTLGVVLALWRYDRLLGLARSPALASVVVAAVDRGLWLLEGIHGGPAPADRGRISAVVAIRDAVRYAAGSPVGTLSGAVDAEHALAVAGRLAADPTCPPDLRGAAFGFGYSLGRTTDTARAVRGAAAVDTLGDWLAGLFAVARVEVLDQDLLAVLDALVGGLTDHDFLVALPALRQAFGYFPPRERETIAVRLGRAHGTDPDLADLTLDVDPVAVARARELDSSVDDLLTRTGLVAGSAGVVGAGEGTVPR